MHCLLVVGAMTTTLLLIGAMGALLLVLIEFRPLSALLILLSLLRVIGRCVSPAAEGTEARR
jgi:hypothetical protein